MSFLKQKTVIRKAIASFKKYLLDKNANKKDILSAIHFNEDLLKLSENELSGPTYNLPTLGKLRMIIEKDLKEEQNKFNNDYTKSGVDIKRLALKSAFYEYYMDLEYDPETVVVSYISDMTLRRDNKKTDDTNFDFAPNKNEIYQRWMEKLNRYVRENKLSEIEFDESAERGVPQGGAFEKQLDRYRKDIMRELWQDYYKQRKQ